MIIDIAAGLASGLVPDPDTLLDDMLAYITTSGFGSASDAATAFSTYNSQAWAAAQTIAVNVFKPVGSVLLTAVFTLNMMRTILSMDANDSSGGVMKLVQAAIRYALWMAATNAAPTIVAAIADTGDKLAARAAAYSGKIAATGTPATADWSGMEWFQRVGAMILLLIPVIVVLVANVGIQVAIVIRFAEFYVLAAGSPVAMSLGGDEATRPAAIGYLRELATVALQGAFIIVIVVVFSKMSLGGLPDFSGGISGILNGIVSVMVGPVAFLVSIFASRRLAGAIVGKG